MSNKPTLCNQKPIWTRIGAAWAHEKGRGFSIELEALPVDGRLVLTEPKADDKGEGTSEPDTFEATKACTQATLQASREFCQRLHLLRSELAIAAEALALSANIQRLKSELQRMRSTGAGRNSDPQTHAIAQLIRLDRAQVRSALAWLLALAVEAVSAFGLFAVTPRRRRVPEPADTGAPWRLSGSNTIAQDKARHWRLARAG